MAGYLLRHPSPSNNIDQAKEEEFWNNWFTVNIVKDVQNSTFILDEQNRQRKMPQPFTEEIANERERTDSVKVAIENHLSMRQKHTIKINTATINKNSHGCYIDLHCMLDLIFAAREWTAIQKTKCGKPA